MKSPLSLRLLRFFLAMAVCWLPGLAAAAPKPESKPVYVATIGPVASLLGRVLGDRAVVHTLLKPGANPHTYEPRPSDLLAVEKAQALVMVSPLLEPYAAQLTTRARLSLFDLVPPDLRLRYGAGEHHDHGEASNRSGHHHPDHEQEGGYDPHFWLDPLAVKAVAPGLATWLCGRDAPSCPAYQRNAEALSADLDRLHQEISGVLRPTLGRPLMLVYPCLRYFVHRYRLEVAGVVVKNPGKEPTPGEIRDAISIATARGVKVLLSSSELPRRPGDLVAESSGAVVVILDPLAGGDYFAMMRRNQQVLTKAMP